jgi:ABC-type lipoprotein release transport system permease subunit
VSAVLFGISPFDPITFAAVIGIFAVTAVVASVLPASAAARIHPVGVLRCD